MKLYLLRHGIAEGRADSGRDEDRKLTDDGIRELEQVIRKAGKAGLVPACILASPYLRTQQTARVAADLLGYRDAIHPSAALTPDASVAELLDEVRVYQENFDSLLLVTHLPLIDDAVRWIASVEDQVTKIPHFYPSTIVFIELETIGIIPKGILRWSLTPEP